MPHSLILVRATLREGCEQKFADLVGKIFPETRTCAGCISISAFTRNDGSRRVILSEQWETVQHYKDYVAWRDSTGALAELVDLLEGPPEAEIWPEGLG